MFADACSAATFAADCANNRLFSSPGVPLGALARFVTSFLTLLTLGDEAIGAPTLAEGGPLLLAGGGEAWRSLTSTSSADEEKGDLRGRLITEEFDEFSRRRRRT